MQSLFFFLHWWNCHYILSSAHIKVSRQSSILRLSNFVTFHFMILSFQTFRSIIFRWISTIKNKFKKAVGEESRWRCEKIKEKWENGHLLKCGMHLMLSLYLEQSLRRSVNWALMHDIRVLFWSQLQTISLWCYSTSRHQQNWMMLKQIPDCSCIVHVLIKLMNNAKYMNHCTK